MEDDERFEALANACLKAHEAVIEVGTPAMVAMTRSLLWQVGQELAQREARREWRNRGPACGHTHHDPRHLEASRY